MNSSRVVFASLVVSGAPLSCSLELLAEPLVFVGGGTASAPTSANWNIDSAWADSLAPASSLDTVLSFSGSGTSSYNATNNFAGTFNLNALLFDSSSTGTVTVTGGTLNFLNDSLSAGPRVTQSGAGNVNLNSALVLGNTLTLDGAGTGSLALNGVVSGSGGLTKTSAGTVTMGGTTANTYTGTTTVSAGELILSKSAPNGGVNAIVGDVLVNGGTLTLAASNQIGNTSALTISDGGTFKLNARTETLGAVTISGTGSTIDLGNQIGSTALITSSNLTFGDGTALVGGGTLRRTGGSLALNLNGGQVSGALINVGVGDAGSTINITKDAGDGSGTLTLGSSGATTTGTVNLNHTGTIDLGVKIIAQSNASGSVNNALNVNVANTATGMSGGIITTALLADIDNPAGPNRIYTSANNSLTFAAGGSGFDLSGGVIDVRTNSTNAAHGSITTNGNNLTISGGSLIGNRLASTTGAITLSNGLLALRDIRNTTTTNFTISSTDGADGRTIKMLSGNTGTFSVANLATSTNRIIIGAQSSGGTWNRGTVNAGQNYSITADGAGTSAFGSVASYTIGDNSGLNGLALGSNALPTQLFLGQNAAFFATTTATGRTYNVGTDSGTNDIVVASTGGFSFGVNNTTNNAANAQVINLRRDKGNADVTLLSNGAHANNAVNLAVNQTGSGNLYVAARQLVLNEGVTFGGTGGIYTDLVSGDGAAQAVLGGGIVAVNGSTSVPIVFTVNGTINGTNTINLNQDNQTGSIVIGSTATIGGVQNWTTSQTSGNGVNFANQLTDASRWTAAVNLSARGSGGSIEASTSTASPSASGNYRFDSLTLMSGGTASTGYYRLTNDVQNDGGSGKEALLVGSLTVGGGIGDGSNGRYLLNLNGQDLYVDGFAAITGMQGRGISFSNDALNSVSEVRALTNTGQTLAGGSFVVVNGATLQFNGGDINNLIFSRNTGTYAADTAAAPNGAGAGTNVKRVLNYQNAATSTTDIGTFTSFLGSGTDTGGNSSTTATGTGGTLRVIGGGYSTSGYILNPVGATGLIDTTDGVTDTTLNDVVIRGNTASDSNGASNATVYPALVVAGNTTVKGNLRIADAVGAANQATLRVGGDSATGYSTTTGPTAHAGTGVLEVTGDLTTESTVNVAIQSNGRVLVGGDVSIAGVGASQSFATANVTGMDGVGIHASSHFTLNGASGAGSPQSVDIAPSVGHFHVGDGSGGTLTGASAQVVLAADLVSVSGVDINGAASRLNLGGHTLDSAAGVTVGGVLAGNGTVIGATTVISGGSLNPGNSPGLLVFNDAVTLQAGSSIGIEIDGSAVRGVDFDAIDFNGGLTIEGGALTFSFSTAIADDVVLNIFDGSALTADFTTVSATGVGAYNGSFALDVGGTSYSAIFGAQKLTLDLATGSLGFVGVAVPEPASWGVLLGACAFLTVSGRRRRRS